KTSLSKVESGVRNFDEDDLTVEISKRILESGWLNVCGRVGPLPPPAAGNAVDARSAGPPDRTHWSRRNSLNVRREHYGTCSRNRPRNHELRGRSPRRR